jgi:hypothetical protein
MSYSPVAAESPQQKSCASVDVIEHRLGVLTPRCVSGLTMQKARRFERSAAQ